MYFKSGTAALLLAAYIVGNNPRCAKFVELGSGEGFSSLILARHYPQAQGLLVDVNAYALQKAKENAHENVQNNISYLCHDLEQSKSLRAKCTQLEFMQADIVLSNPPYFAAQMGRSSKDPARALALHQHEQSLDNFCKCAGQILRHHGFFFLIYTPTGLAHVLETLSRYDLGLRNILPIHTRARKPAKWILVLARKGAKPDLQMEQSLQIYAHEQGTELSCAALRFCPWLVNM